MSKQNIDLNIQNYTINELIDLLDLQEPIDKDQIIINSNTIIQSYNNNNTEDKAYTTFIENVRNKLIHYINNDTLSNSSIDDSENTTSVNNLNTLNLNIQNYSIDELYDLFKIPINSDITKQIIEDAYINVTNKISSDIHFEVSTKTKLTTFFKKAYFKLLKEHNNTIYGNQFTNSVPEVDTPITIDQHRYDILQQPQVTQNNDNFIINTKDVNPQDIFINKFPSGVINSIRKKTTTYVVNIDTLFRKNYSTTSATNFLYNFPNPINNVVSMKLTAAEIPVIWYMFSSELNNNTFNITITNVATSPAPQNLTITIPNGNYTALDFVEKMNHYLQSNDTFPHQNLAFLHFELDEQTSRLIIRANNKLIEGGGVPCPYDPLNASYSPNFSFTLDFDVNNNGILYKNAGWMLGFRNATYDIDNTNTYDDYLIQDTPVNFIGYLISEGAYGNGIDNFVFISIDDFNKSFKNSIISSDGNSYLGDNILGRITVSSGSNTILLDNTSDKIFKQRDFFGPVKIKKIQIKLLNKFGDILNLNHNDYSIALEFTQLYT